MHIGGNRNSKRYNSTNMKALFFYLGNRQIIILQRRAQTNHLYKFLNFTGSQAEEMHRYYLQSIVLV